MDLRAPTDDEFQALLSRHSTRHPSKAHLTVIGDGDVQVRLPLVLGNPTGCSRMPEGVEVSPAWDEHAAAILRLRKSGGREAGEALVEDCVLWPEPATWAQWAARWPGLPNSALALVARKVAVLGACVKKPGPKDTAPGPIAATLGKHPRAVWRKLAPEQGEEMAIALDAPDGVRWQFFVDGSMEPGARLGALAADMLAACTLACVRLDGTAAPIGDVVDRWPGLALLLTQQVAELAGATAEVALGEW